MPKVNRNGQAAVLKDEQLEEVFDYLPQPHALIFQICYYTAARIGEVVQLQAEDIVGGYIVYRARTTKTKKTRQVAIASPLAKLLEEADLPKQGCLFSGRFSGHITTRACDKVLRETLDYLGIRGVSTHSFRRWRSLTGGESLLTMMHFEKGYSLRTLQKITQHEDIGNLAKYLEIGQQEADEALRSLWD